MEYVEKKKKRELTEHELWVRRQWYSDWMPVIRFGVGWGIMIATIGLCMTLTMTIVDQVLDNPAILASHNFNRDCMKIVQSESKCTLLWESLRGND